MTSRFRWLIWVFVGWFIIAAAFRAFSKPWTWNSAQWELVVLVALFSVGPAMWAYIWMRDGAEGVEARRAELKAAAATRRPSKWQYGFWIGVALALVVLFNFLDRPHH